ncbi:MAG TPA: deoxyribodipyrimidine photo-lyase [Mesotoga sp.]|nr:deoxyribodipyrimidine photo-lyase [Mesotoga sp.]
MKSDRIHNLSKRRDIKGRFIMYWMQASQRTEENPALEIAKQEAKRNSLPLIVLFVFNTDYPSANLRNFSFMIDGLKAVKSKLKEMGIRFTVLEGNPTEIVPRASRNCALIVTDVGYLRHQIAWRREIAKASSCPVIAVEANVVVPVKAASNKEEYSAATFRPRVLSRLQDFITDFESIVFEPGDPVTDFETTFDLDNPDLSNIDHTASVVSNFPGGQEEANRQLEIFLETKIDRFEKERNDPNCDCLSEMSPFLHFGQISPCLIARRVMESGSSGIEAYLEELIVRRELSMNFVFYNSRYDSFEALPPWAQKTLNEHRSDRREYVYSLSELEDGMTHDPYWNAAQREMVAKGKMHGYMRMYWGKKILEWSPDPETAISSAIYLNDKYELDGRDPNGYSGILWCFGKHDRAWAERSVFGKVRYMNSNGLKRKFDADAYVQKISSLTSKE